MKYTGGDRVWLDINFKYQNPADLAHIIAQPFSLHFNVVGGVTKKNPQKKPFMLESMSHLC